MYTKNITMVSCCWRQWNSIIFTKICHLHWSDRKEQPYRDQQSADRFQLHDQYNAIINGTSEQLIHRVNLDLIKNSVCITSSISDTDECLNSKAQVGSKMECNHTCRIHLVHMTGLEVKKPNNNPMTPLKPNNSSSWQQWMNNWALTDTDRHEPANLSCS